MEGAWEEAKKNAATAAAPEETVAKREVPAAASAAIPTPAYVPAAAPGDGAAVYF
jgi:hypothetical protein